MDLWHLIISVFNELCVFASSSEYFQLVICLRSCACVLERVHVCVSCILCVSAHRDYLQRDLDNVGAMRSCRWACSCLLSIVCASVWGSFFLLAIFALGRCRLSGDAGEPVHTPAYLATIITRWPINTHGRASWTTLKGVHTCNAQRPSRVAGSACYGDVLQDDLSLPQGM